MTPLGLGGSPLRQFLDIVAKLCMGWRSMRRGLQIRVAFAPTRLWEAHLRTAYEVVSPTAKRAVSVRQPAPAESCAIASAVQQCQRGS